MSEPLKAKEEDEEGAEWLLLLLFWNNKLVNVQRAMDRQVLDVKGNVVKLISWFFKVQRNIIYIF